MRVFVAGAGGAVARPLIPLLIKAGHTVGALTRSESKRNMLSKQCAAVYVADALVATAVCNAVETFRPDAVINQLTAIPQKLDIRHFEREFAITNRLRTEGMDSLVAAAKMAGVKRFVAQSFAGTSYARVGGRIKTEEDPLDSKPPQQFRSTFAAVKYLESAVVRAFPERGIVLRYGCFYGPGTSIDAGSSVVDAVQKRTMPIVAGGTGVWSFVHIDDVASATLAALDGPPGVFNVADDEPALVRDWISYLAELLHAKPPFRVPAWVARLLVGDQGIAVMRDNRGVSNAKAKRELGWRPAYPSWKEGFKLVFGR